MRGVVLVSLALAVGCSHEIVAAPKTCTAKAGCHKVAALPVCPLGLATRTLADVTAHSGVLRGKEVAVVGPLRHTKVVCSETKCAPNTCCNHCSAQLVLATRNDVQSITGARDAILLESLDAPEQFRCTGDDSGVCCPAQADGVEVVARGTLARAGFAEESHTLRLIQPMLCRLVGGP